MSTEIYMGSRGSGKTLTMIRESAKTGAYIVCLDKTRVEHILKMARELGYNIPYPMTAEEMFGIVNDPHIRQFNNSICIDQFDCIVQLWLKKFDVKAATCDNFSLFKLDDDEDDREVSDMWMRMI